MSAREQNQSELISPLEGNDNLERGGVNKIQSEGYTYIRAYYLVQTSLKAL